LAATLLISLLALPSCASSGSTIALPNVGLASAVGNGELNPAELREPAIVNLWATWCVPCKQELPALEGIFRDPGNQVRIIGINIGDSDDAVTQFIDDLGLTFEQYIDRDGVVESKLRVTTLPATIAIGADARLIEVHQGVLDEAGFRALIARANGS
jgi:thiol-disulfide isomerase/thioredoxin